MKTLPAGFKAGSFPMLGVTEDGVVQVHHELAWIHETQPLAVHFASSKWRVSHSILGYNVMFVCRFLTPEQALDSCRRLAAACDWHQLTPENAKDGPYRKAVLDERDQLIKEGSKLRL